jgi:hypothetical protein
MWCSIMLAVRWMRGRPHPPDAEPPDLAILHWLEVQEREARKNVASRRDFVERLLIYRCDQEDEA